MVSSDDLVDVEDDEELVAVAAAVVEHDEDVFR